MFHQYPSVSQSMFMVKHLTTNFAETFLCRQHKCWFFVLPTPISNFDFLDGLDRSTIQLYYVSRLGIESRGLQIVNFLLDYVNVIEQKIKNRGINAYFRVFTFN